MKKHPLFQEIDWHEQWKEFSPHFTDGIAHVDLTPFGGGTLLMQPGAGFGDFSHETTRLTLSLMAPLVKGALVIDIGCGSGILSIAAALLKAERAIGIDICAEALIHSKKNAELNAVQHLTLFTESLDSSFTASKETLIVMNMIHSEQRCAWQAVPELHTCKATVITSGILASEKAAYLNTAKAWGWTLQEEAQESEWLALKFSQNGTPQLIVI